MKRCPECRRDYYDDTLLYCLDDGNALLDGPASMDEPATAILPSGVADTVQGRRNRNKRVLAALFVLAILLVGGFFGYRYFGSNFNKENAISFSQAKLTRLTTTGKASDAAISPDGKYVVHVKSDAGQQSLWLRQVVTTSDTQTERRRRRRAAGREVDDWTANGVAGILRVA